MIGIAGGTGSGKTTIAAKLAGAIPPGRCVVIEHDAYYRDQSGLTPDERATINYDHPSALESSLLAEHLRRLRAGETVEVPIYDFATHTRRADTRRVASAPVILVEGILVFVEAKEPETIARHFRGYGGTVLRTTLAPRKAEQLQQLLAAR